jgi:hypothetical protein
VKICNQTLLQNDSEFRIIQTLAHELSHSIDPCNIEGPVGTGFQYSKPQSVGISEGEYPIPDLLSCLRDSRSVSATRQTWLRNPLDKVKDSLADTMVDLSSAQGKPPKREGRLALLCLGDQLPEAFATWMGSEILEQYIGTEHPAKGGRALTREQLFRGYANALRSQCVESGGDGDFAKSWYNFTEHPSPEVQIDRIIFANPGIREQICGKDQLTEPNLSGGGVIYCSGRAVSSKEKTGVK